MGATITVQQMLEQALDQVRLIDRYLAWIADGNGIKMLNQSFEESTAGWKRQLVEDRKRHVDFIAAIKSDPRYSVRIDSHMYPEFETY